MNARMKSLLAEFMGTLLITCAVVGSAVMATRLSDDRGVRLLINAVSTTLVLGIAIAFFKRISGAHFNPVVTVIQGHRKILTIPTMLGYIASQLLGSVCGALLANGMFSVELFHLSNNSRGGGGVFLAEIVATFGLVLLVLNPAILHEVAIPAWIASAYFFTASTSFANPAITFGRVFTSADSGIALQSVLGFVIAQLIGAALAYLLWSTIWETHDPTER